MPGVFGDGYASREQYAGLKDIDMMTAIDDGSRESFPEMDTTIITRDRPRPKSDSRV